MINSKKTIAIFGASGFIGSSLIAQLSQSNYHLKLFSRNKEKIKLFTVDPRIEVFDFNLNDIEQVKKDLNKTDVVINLLGILHQSKKESFDKIHHLWPISLTKIMKETSIKRLIHLGALGSGSNVSSLYLQSKALGESYLIKQKYLDITILRPSIIFGAKDNFINMFKFLVKWVPMIILLSPQSKFQPIYIEDVSNILIKSMFDKKTFGKVYDLGGSDIYTLKDIVRLIIKSEKLNRIIIPLNKSLSYLFAFSMELMPIKILTRDNWRSMQVDNVVNNEHSIHYRYTFMRLGRYLDQNKQNTPLMRSRYDSFRSKSGR